MIKKTVTQEEMEALKTLAESNLRVSEAKNKLSEIQKNKIEAPIVEEEKPKEVEPEVIPVKPKASLVDFEEVATTISKQQMDSVKALSETNLQISEAKNILFNLKKEETEYLLSREKKVIERLNELYQESKTTLDDINNNYQGAKIILQLVNETTLFLKESQTQFQELVTNFDERYTAWEKEASDQEEKFISIKKGLDQEKVEITNTQKSIERMKAIMAQDRRKIEDDRATLERAFNRLKK